MPRWPDKEFIIKEVVGTKNTIVTMLGSKENLEWKNVDSNIVVRIRQLSVDELPCSYAYVLKLTSVE